MRKLVNPKFQQLRSWLYPGQAGEGSAPTQVAEEVQAVIDVEHWVPIPRYMAMVKTLNPPANAFASINFEAFTAPAPSSQFRPNRFMVTDFRAVMLNSPTDFVSIQTRNDGGWEALTITAGVSNIRTFSGDAAQSTLQSGNTSQDPIVPSGGGPLLTVFALWLDLPDVMPGNCIQFTQTVADLNLDMAFSWSERRPDGTNQ